MMRHHRGFGWGRLLRQPALHLALTASVVASCAAAMRPAVMAEASGFRTSPQGAAAEKHAPQAFSHAVEVEQSAERLFEADDVEGAELTGQGALAAYQKASLLARLARAAERELDAHAALSAVQHEVRRLENEQRDLALEADALEMKLNVVRDAAPLVPNARADEAREAARRSAVNALATEARMLCVAAQMLDPKRSEPVKLLGDIDVLVASVGDGKPAPIDAATAARSACLKALSAIRAPAREVSPSSSESDALLGQLSDAGYEPHRDDRGVVITLRALTQGGALTPPIVERLGAIARTARAHAGLPILVAGHGTGKNARPRAAEAAALVAGELSRGGVTGVQTVTAGDSLPVTSATSPGALSNERIEIVFVTRAW